MKIKPVLTLFFSLSCSSRVLAQSVTTGEFIVLFVIILAFLFLIFGGGFFASTHYSKRIKNQEKEGLKISKIIAWAFTILSTIGGILALRVFLLLIEEINQHGLARSSEEFTSAIVLFILSVLGFIPLLIMLNAEIKSRNNKKE